MSGWFNVRSHLVSGILSELVSVGRSLKDAEETEKHTKQILIYSFSWVRYVRIWSFHKIISSSNFKPPIKSNIYMLEMTILGQLVHCGISGGGTVPVIMVRALDSWASGPGSSPGREHCVVFLGKTLYSRVASSKVYKWVPANLMLRPGVTPRWTSIPSRGSRNTPSRFMSEQPGEAPAWPLKSLKALQW